MNLDPANRRPNRRRGAARDRRLGAASAHERACRSATATPPQRIQFVVLAAEKRMSLSPEPPARRRGRGR